MTTKSHLLRCLEAGAVLLFFLQSLRVIFSVLFGIIYDRLFVGPVDWWMVGSVLLLLAAFLLPALARLNSGRGWLAGLSVFVIAARIGLSINIADVRYWSALFVIVGASLYLAVLLKTASSAVLPAFLIALTLDQVLRAAGHTYDLSLRQSWLLVQVVLSILLFGLVAWCYRRDRSLASGSIASGPLWGLAVGGFLFVEISLLSLPNAIARWSEWSYALIAPSLLIVTLALWTNELRRLLLATLSERFWLRLMVSFSLPMLMLLGYFSTGWPAAIALQFAHVLALVALIHLLSANQLAGVSSPPLSRGAGGDSPGPWLSLGLVFFLVLNFLNAFAFTYPYTLPFLRGSGWLFYLIGGLALGVGMIPKRTRDLPIGETDHGGALTFLTGLVLLGITVASVWPASLAEQPSGDTLRVATYNIHYGYDEDWRFNMEEIAQTIEADGVDIIAMQEVDTGRLTSFGVDDAYYLARRLKMNALYLPTIEHLTGIALLYKGSAQIRDARLLTSLQEQTGITHVHLDSAISPVHAYGIWIGLSAEDTLRQIREALDFIGESSPAVFGGDFNSDPESAVVAEIRQAGFVDPFIELAIRPVPPTAPADGPTERIDYVWVRGLTPLRAWVSSSLASDHRMVVVEVVKAPGLKAQTRALRAHLWFSMETRH